MVWSRGDILDATAPTAERRYIMTNDQFYGIFIILLFILVIVEIGMFSIRDYLKEIKELLEKYINQKPPKGE